MSTIRFSDININQVFEDPNSASYFEVLFTAAAPWATRNNPLPEGGLSLSYAIELTGSASIADFEYTYRTIAIEPGTRKIQLAIDTVDDNEQEIGENFTVRLVDSNFADVSSAGLLMTIIDNDIRREIKDLNHELLEVHRFFNTESGRHFYTAGEQEAEFVLNNIDSFVLEESASFFSASPYDWMSSPLYRFFNQDTGVHFYTISGEEKEFIINNYDQYRFEGTGFHAWDSQIAPLNSSPVYRFFNPNTGSHFFAMSDEAEYVRQNLPGFIDEGVAFNVFENAGETSNWGEIYMIQFLGGRYESHVGVQIDAHENVPIDGYVEVNIESGDTTVSQTFSLETIYAEGSNFDFLEENQALIPYNFDDFNLVSGDVVGVTAYLVMSEPFVTDGFQGGGPIFVTDSFEPLF